MNVLNYEDLEDKIFSFIDKSSQISSDFNQYLILLKNTGFRPKEALNFNNVISSNVNHIVFKPSKRNNVRIVELEKLPDLFLYYYLNHTITYKTNKYRRFLEIFDERIVDKKYFCSGKRCSLYLFRYYYVRTLYKNGMELNDICQHMGWINEALPASYVFRPITY